MTNEAKVALITGAGSGVGQSVAVRLSKKGWLVGLVGRRAAALEETARQCEGRTLVCPCDIGDEGAVRQVADRVARELGPIEVLINAAGLNTPARALAVLNSEDYREIVNTNLNGAFYCVQAVLPIMRERGSGTIVNIVSDAGLRANAKAGPSYVVSKFGLAGLTQAINAEEREHGVRACAIFPGDINTPLLDRRPVPPPAEARQLMLQPEDVADCVMLAIELPPRAIVEELVVRPR